MNRVNCILRNEMKYCCKPAGLRPGNHSGYWTKHKKTLRVIETNDSCTLLATCCKIRKGLHLLAAVKRNSSEQRANKVLFSQPGRHNIRCKSRVSSISTGRMIEIVGRLENQLFVGAPKMHINLVMTARLLLFTGAHSCTIGRRYWCTFWSGSVNSGWWEPWWMTKFFFF